MAAGGGAREQSWRPSHFFSCALGYDAAYFRSNSLPQAFCLAHPPSARPYSTPGTTSLPSWPLCPDSPHHFHSVPWAGLMGSHPCSCPCRCSQPGLSFGPHPIDTTSASSSRGLCWLILAALLGSKSGVEPHLCTGLHPSITVQLVPFPARSWRAGTLP